MTTLKHHDQFTKEDPDLSCRAHMMALIQCMTSIPRPSEWWLATPTSQAHQNELSNIYYTIQQLHEVQQKCKDGEIYTHLNGKRDFPEIKELTSMYKFFLGNKLFNDVITSPKFLTSEDAHNVLMTDKMCHRDAIRRMRNSLSLSDRLKSYYE